jgi:tape measure domain-containing protein
MRALGTSAEGVQNILAQLGQVQAKGKLQGEELTVLAENGLSTQLVYKHLASQLGKTKDEILKMQAAGKLTSEMAFPAIMAAVMDKTGEKQLGDVGKQIADQTMSGMAGQIKAKAQNAFINIGTGATHSLMSAFRPMAAELGDLFQSDSMQRGLILAVETIAQVARDSIPFVKEFVGSLGQGFMEAWPAMQGATDVLSDFFGKGQDTMEFVKTLGKTLGQVAAAAVTVGVVFGGMLVGGIQLATGVIQTAIFMWDSLISGIGAALFAVDDFFSNIGAKWRAFDFGALAGSLIEGLVNGITNGAQWVYDAVTSLGSGVIQKFRSVLDINSPSKEFEYLGQMSGLGFSQGLEGSLASNDNGRMLPSFTSGVGSLMGAGGGGGMGDVSVSVVIHVNGSDAPEETARLVKRSLETELGGVFERIAAERAA